MVNYVTYFVQDYLKDGGMYETLSERVKKIEFGGVELESGTVIAIQDIIQIDV